MVVAAEFQETMFGVEEPASDSIADLDTPEIADDFDEAERSGYETPDPEATGEGGVETEEAPSPEAIRQTAIAERDAHWERQIAALQSSKDRETQQATDLSHAYRAENATLWKWLVDAAEASEDGYLHIPSGQIHKTRYELEQARQQAIGQRAQQVRQAQQFDISVGDARQALSQRQQEHLTQQLRLDDAAIKQLRAKPTYQRAWSALESAYLELAKNPNNALLQQVASAAGATAHALEDDFAATLPANRRRQQVNADSQANRARAKARGPQDRSTGGGGGGIVNPQELTARAWKAHPGSSAAAEAARLAYVRAATSRPKPKR